MPGWELTRRGLAAGAVLLAACAAGRSPAPSPDAANKLMRWSAGHAVAEGVAKQTIPAGQEANAASRVVKPGQAIWVRSGKSRIIEFDRPVQRVSIANPDLAAIVVLGPRSIMVNAKDLPKEKREQYERAELGNMVFVSRTAAVSNKTFTPEPRVAETSLIVWEKGDDGHYDSHSLFIADFSDQEVMLEVTVAELNRTAMEGHGIDFRKIGNSFVSAYFLGGGFGPKPPGVLNTVPSQLSQPLLPLTLSDTAPNYVFQLPQDDITAFIKLLQTEGLATVLAQPKIIAMSGQNAVFQVGGEIPIRIVTSFVADIQFKPFGTLVNFVPRVSDEGDILLTVTPEVSQPDFNSLVEGIPSFQTRRASTSARLRNGETLVIGGLLQNKRVEQVRGVPYAMNLPGIGYIFRDTSYSVETTELMVVVTPHLVQPLPPGTELALPTDRPPLQFEEIRTQPDPAVVTRPRLPGALAE